MKLITAKVGQNITDRKEVDIYLVSAVMGDDTIHLHSAPDIDGTISTIEFTSGDIAQINAMFALKHKAANG